MALKLMFKGLWQNVWFANKIRWKQLRPQVFYNHYPSQFCAGRRFPCISSQGYQSLKNTYCCTSYNYTSSFLSSISLTRHSYVCAILSLNCFHSKARDLILTTVFLTISSLWSHTSCEVLDTAWASNSLISSWSCWMMSMSFTIWV